MKHTIIQALQSKMMQNTQLSMQIELSKPFNAKHNFQIPFFVHSFRVSRVSEDEMRSFSTQFSCFSC